MTEIAEVIDCTADFLGIDKSEINENTDLRLDLGLSSFDLMELSCELEEHFSVKINAEQLASVKCIGDLKTITRI
jgi:acyl carrier protein